MACGITPPLAALLQVGRYAMLQSGSGRGLLCPQIAEALQQLFVQDPDNLVRERAAKCMTVIGRKATGVRKILVCGALPMLLDLFHDAELAVR